MHKNLRVIKPEYKIITYTSSILYTFYQIPLLYFCSTGKTPTQNLTSFVLLRTLQSTSAISIQELTLNIGKMKAPIFFYCHSWVQTLPLQYNKHTFSFPPSLEWSINRILPKIHEQLRYQQMQKCVSVRLFWLSRGRNEKNKIKIEIASNNIGPTLSVCKYVCVREKEKGSCLCVTRVLEQ